MHLSQRAHVDLPGSVFRLPSAPMMTSNSSSLTGCVLGWTSALQPIPKKKKKPQRLSADRNEPGEPASVQYQTRAHSPLSSSGSALTFRLLIFRRLDETLKLHVDVDLDAEQKSHLEQHQLELADTCGTAEGA